MLIVRYTPKDHPCTLWVNRGDGETETMGPLVHTTYTQHTCVHAYASPLHVYLRVGTVQHVYT